MNDSAILGLPVLYPAQLLGLLLHYCREGETHPFPRGRAAAALGHLQTKAIFPKEATNRLITQGANVFPSQILYSENRIERTT